MRRVAALLALISAASIAGPSARAFNQPPTNLSVTTFLDGGAPPGLYYLNYSVFSEGRRARDREGDDGRVKPGQRFHVNYAFSREIASRWRAGIAGYFLTQTTEDEVNGVKSSGSKERTAAAGPGLVYSGKGLTMMLSHPVEFAVQNRFQGSRTTLQLIHRF